MPEIILEVRTDHQAATAPLKVWPPIDGCMRKRISPMQNFQNRMAQTTANQIARLRRGRRYRRQASAQPVAGTRAAPIGLDQAREPPPDCQMGSLAKTTRRWRTHKLQPVRMTLDIVVCISLRRQLTPELNEAGGPAYAYWEPTWPASFRSSDLVSFRPSPHNATSEKMLCHPSQR